MFVFFRDCIGELTFNGLKNKLSYNEIWLWTLINADHP